MNGMELFKKTVTLLRKNLKSLAGFEICYRILSVFLLVPLLSSGFNLVMALSGYRYLTKENYMAFLTKPSVVLLLLILVVITAAVETWHIGTIICILDQSWQDKKTTVRSALFYAVKQSRWLLRGGNILVLLYLLVMLPFMSLGTGVVGSISIPEYIMETIQENAILLSALTGVSLLFLFLILRWMFAFHYLMIEHTSFFAGARKSAALSKGKKIINFVLILLVQVAIILIYAVVALIGIGLIFLLQKLSLFAADILISVIGIFLLVTLVLVSALATPISYAAITVLFYNRKEQIGEPAVFIQAGEMKPVTPAHIKRGRILTGIMAVVLVGTGVLFVRGLRHGDYNLNIEHVRTMEVSAHRGASAYYPENTMAAFRGAVEQNADWIELDVQQSKDGEIFVMHDTNFYRTTGVNKNCWEMTWDEISQLDAGSFFSKEYAGEQIPRLEEVIEYAKLAGIRLNIELKPTGHETDFEKKVVDIIKDADFEDSCVVTSQVYDVLKNIKEYEPSITTVYVMAVAVGKIQELEYADNFSIEATFVSQSLVQKMHSLHKEVYAWTIDSKTSINSMIDTGVDNIITNNVPLAKQCVEESRTSNLIQDLVTYIRTFGQ